MKKISKAVKSVENEQEVSASQTSNTITAVATVEAHSTETTVIEPLTLAEAEQLAKCEETIQKGLKWFQEVYDALQEVCEHRLYRHEYSTFEKYCREKWKICDRHVNRLMVAAEVVANVKGDQLVFFLPTAVPATESQARELAPLSKAEQIEAARIVAKKQGKHTAKDFKEAAKKVAGEKPKVTRSDIADDDEKPSVQSYDPRNEDAEDEKPAPNTKPSEQDELGTLLELVDQAQTQARKITSAADVVKILGDVAKLITRKLNGVAK